MCEYACPFVMIGPRAWPAPVSVIWCGESSPLTHVTDEPALVLSLFGPNAKPAK